MNLRPIDQYIEMQAEADRATCNDHAPSSPDPVGEWLLIPVMAAIALIGGWLMGWHV